MGLLTERGDAHLMEPQKLRLLAGDAAYERGVVYYEEGRVGDLIDGGNRVTATVEGSHSYRVELRVTSRLLEGSCNCPASDGFDFCKHCVATALALQARQRDLHALAESGPEDRIRAFLVQQPADALVQILMNAIPDQPELRDQLLLQADVLTGKINARYLKKQLTTATPMRDIWERQQVREYFARIESTLAGIRAIASDVPAKDLLATVLHGFTRLERVLERVDDSDANRWFTQHDLRELHLNALSRLSWRPDTLAEHLLDLALKDPADQFERLLEDYEGVLGEKGLAAFFALVQSRLDALPALAFGAEFEQTYPYLQLTGFLRERAEAADDVPALIELAKRTCTSAFDYHRISALYLRLPDLDAALTWLDKAEAVAAPRGRDHELRVAIHSAREEWSDALVAQRKIFESHPDRSAYESLQALAVNAGNVELVQAEAKRFLRGQLQGRVWERELAAVTLAAIHCSEDKPNQAFDVIREYVFDPGQLLALIPWFTEQAPSLQCELVARAIEGFIGHKNKSGYRKAVDVLEDSRDLFERVSDGAFDTFVAELRVRHRPKRNLMALLDAL